MLLKRTEYLEMIDEALETARTGNDSDPIGLLSHFEAMQELSREIIINKFLSFRREYEIQDMFDSVDYIDNTIQEFNHILYVYTKNIDDSICKNCNKSHAKEGEDFCCGKCEDDYKTSNDTMLFTVEHCTIAQDDLGFILQKYMHLVESVKVTSDNTVINIYKNTSDFQYFYFAITRHI